jgi:N-acyl homoserine lactone hydrolase
VTIELTIFRTGAVKLARSNFAPWLAAPERDELVECPVWSALLRTPEGLIVFDTGLHPVHIERPEATFGPNPGMLITMDADDAIVSRLAAMGVRPDDVTVIVNSHLHFDHAGNNRAFPNATFIVQAEHLVYAKGRPNFPAIYWDDPALRYMPATGRARVAAGIEVVPTPDAAFTRANLERGEIPGQDPVAGKESLGVIRSLVKDDLERAFPSHDPTTFRPGTYD